MYKIGITGSIGTGKTTIANMFAIFNIPIFDADLEIKKILRKKDVLQKLKRIWPLIFKKDQIDKPKLKQIIFSYKSEKKKLEKLLYPYLESELEKFEKINHRKKILIYDVPLIYETKTEKKYDMILLAHCDIKKQRERVLSRDKISNSLFERIIASQLSFNDKIKFKPKIIKTNNFKLFIFIKVISLLIKTQIRLRSNNEKKKVNTRYRNNRLKL